MTTTPTAKKPRKPRPEIVIEYVYKPDTEAQLRALRRLLGLPINGPEKEPK
jgi:hypothetical protein